LPWINTRRAGTPLKGIAVSSGGVRGVWQRYNPLTKHERLLRLEKATGECKIELKEGQIRLLERFSPEFRERHIEAPFTGALVAVDTFFVGALKGVGKVYLQTAIDCHSRYAWARLYPSKLPVTAVHVMNHDVIPTFEEHNAKIEVVLSDNGREFCGRPDQHPFELYLQLEDIEPLRQLGKRPVALQRRHRHLRLEGRRVFAPCSSCHRFSCPASILEAIFRQKLHLSHCTDFRGLFSTPSALTEKPTPPANVPPPKPTDGLTETVLPSPNLCSNAMTSPHKMHLTEQKF
jgi:hypothetical protein